MRKFAFFLTVFAFVILVPWWIGVLGRLVAYGFTAHPAGTALFVTALAAWGVAAIIRCIWREKPEGAQ